MARNAIERDADRVFLIHLFRSAGGHLQVNEAARILNDRRAAAAREVAAALGRNEREIEEAGERARLNVSTISRDVTAIRASLQEVVRAGAAGWIQQQLDDLDRDYERTYELEGYALEELARSRQVTSEKRHGEMMQDGTERWQRIESYREDRAGNSALLRIIGDQLDRRQRLRQEQRSLLFGKAWVEQSQERGNETRRSIAEIMSGTEDDPAAAAERVRSLYESELQRLILDESMELGPAAPEYVQMERLRLERNKRAFEAMDKFLRQSSGPGSKRTISVEFKVLPAGSEAN